MRIGGVFCAVIGLVICVAQANAAQPSAAKMSQMGLSSATIVSDSDAMSVRGFGYRGGNKVTIYGQSKIEVKVKYGPVKVEVESKNGYHSTTNGSQIGGNVSVVGVAVIGGDNNGGNGEGGGAAFNGGGMNGGGGVPILFGGGVSGVHVIRGRH